MKFTKVIFRPIIRLKLIGRRFPKRSSNFYSVLSWENTSVAFTIFGIVCFEAFARRLDDVSNNPCGRLGNQTPGQHPKILSLPLFSLDTIDHIAPLSSLYSNILKESAFKKVATVSGQQERWRQYLSFVKFTVNLAYKSCVFLFFSSSFVLHVVLIHLRFFPLLSLSFFMCPLVLQFSCYPLTYFYLMLMSTGSLAPLAPMVIPGSQYSNSYF